MPPRPELPPRAGAAPARGWRLPAAMALIAAAAALLYLPTLRHGFLFDDSIYVTEEPVVAKGLTWEGLRWALTSLKSGYWHPLTWLSHMADVQLFGMAPGPHHAAGLLLHAASAALLLLALARMTGALWRPALVAALFALHPLHVESVAWTAERKDVLLGFFWMLALLAHGRAARTPAPGRRAAVALLFLLALMAKPMAVTLPLALVVLDAWPLGRFAGAGRRGELRRALLEKLPLFALAVAGSLLTLAAAVPTGALPTLEALPLASRLGNAAVAAAMYLVRTAWPAGLAAYYPLPRGGPPFAAWGPAVAALAAITFLAVRERRRRPWLAAGWAWYLVTLLPVSGLVQLGSYARADRYTYLPLIGVFVIFAWGAGELLARFRRGAAAGAAVAIALIAALGALGAMAAAARVQIGFWKDPAALFGHALEVTEGNWLAHYGLAKELTLRGEYARAEEHYRKAALLNPGYKEARNNLGILLARRGDLEGALALFREALALRPGAADVHYNIGVTLEQLGRIDAAREAYGRALALDPGQRESRDALQRLGPGRAPGLAPPPRGQ